MSRTFGMLKTLARAIFGPTSACRFQQQIQSYKTCWRNMFSENRSSIFLWAFGSISFECLRFSYRWIFQSWIFGEYIFWWAYSHSQWPLSAKKNTNRRRTRWPSFFPAQPFGDFKVCSELASVVGRYGFGGFPVWEEQLYHGPCRRLCLSLPPLRQFLHENEVGGPFREREDGVSVEIHDGIHFQIPESWSVCFFRPQVYACPACDVCCLCRA